MLGAVFRPKWWWRLVAIDKIVEKMLKYMVHGTHGL